MLKTTRLAAALLFSFGSIGAMAQTTYLNLGTEDYRLLDRLETRSGRLTEQFFTTVKPIARKGAVKFLEEKRLAADSIGLTGIDRYNIDHAISTSGEWATDSDGAIDSKVPWFKTFYKKQPDLFRVNNPDFFLSVNPIIAAQATYENTSPDRGSDNPLFMNSRGLEIRGRIVNKIGFYTMFTDNQETPPAFVRDWINKYTAVPGADFYQTPKAGKYDYLLARGYVDFEAVKDHINVSLGYDKQFLGDGERTLFLSDFASSGATFVRLNTKIWKLNYQNLYMELTPQYDRRNDRVLPHKYATMHHLSINATKWLNVGLFEGVMFGRPDRYQFSYMIPIIFYRQIERSNGSPDNAVLGINFKALAAKHLQFYGQLLLDEFRSKELIKGTGHWGNKFGVQLGGKYFDAFTVKNLDLQGEVNIVRPFTYSHYDTIANFSHYNQPLAHPLQAGFGEIIGIARYQPIRDLFLSLKGTYYQAGNNIDTLNYGNQVFRPYNVGLPKDGNGNPLYSGYSLISGVKSTCLIAELNASYELRENLFIDLGFTTRRYKLMDGVTPDFNTNYFYGGFRLNLARHNYNFY